MTWTHDGSPYVLDGSVTVAAGATLTIEPNVVVLFNGTFVTLQIDGTLNAVAPSDTSRIVFTSIKDDVPAGDVAGDGYTTGAPGQWNSIVLDGAGTTSNLKYVDIRYGGYGYATWTGAEVIVTNSATALIDHATITNSQTSGLLVNNPCAGCWPGVIVTHSGFTQDAAGIYVSMGWASIGSNTQIVDNSGDGVTFNLTASYNGPTSVITDTDVAQNGNRGVYIQAPSNLADAYLPHGTRNNIFRNSGKQLDVAYLRPGDDWKGNYWGDSVIYGATLACPRPHLKYTYSTSNPPDGPIQWHYYVNGSSVCAEDNVPIQGTEFSTIYLGHGGDSGQGTGGFDAAYYSFSDSTCGTYSDPVTVVFYGNALLSNVLTHIEHHTGWGEPALSSDQWFLTNNACLRWQAERASGATSRFHIRLSQTAADDPTLGTTALGTPHHEDIVVCGGNPPINHAVDSNGPNGSGFDQGRQEIIADFSLQHYSYGVYKGNTRSFHQCDGDYAGSNGYVIFMNIP